MGDHDTLQSKCTATFRTHCNMAHHVGYVRKFLLFLCRRCEDLQFGIRKSSINAVHMKEMDLLNTSKAFNVPRLALKHYVKMNESNTKIIQYVFLDFFVYICTRIRDFHYRYLKINFDIHMSVHHKFFSKLQPTRCNVS